MTKSHAKKYLKQVLKIPIEEITIRCVKKSNENQTKQIAEQQTTITSKMNNRKVIRNTQAPISSRGLTTALAHSAEARGNTRTRAKVNTLRKSNDANGRLKIRNKQDDDVTATVKGKSVMQDTNELSYNTPYKVWEHDT